MGSAALLATSGPRKIGPDSVFIDGDHNTTLRARWHNDTLTGVVASAAGPDGRWRFVRRTSPAVAESYFPLWPGPLSDSAYSVTEDTLVYMHTRDGARLASYAAPRFPSALAHLASSSSALRTGASTRRSAASGHHTATSSSARMSAAAISPTAMTSATTTPMSPTATTRSNGPPNSPALVGHVGMVGHSDEGRLAWYAALNAPPHLAALAPSAASSDPWRISPYEDMVFAPINVSWACLMRARRLTDVDDLPIGSAMRHLPVADLPQFLGCGNIPLWNRWLDHESLDAYWRAHGVTTHIAGVRAPVLQLTGWYDDSRGPIDYTNALAAVPHHPPIRLVIGPGAHQGVDHVAGDFGPESRVDERQLQLRWFDHYLRGVDNGVDREPSLDYFLIGDNHWHHAPAWPPADVHATRFFLHSRGHANTSAGDGWIDTVPPGAEPHDEYRYDPSDPTPYLIDSRELETSLNEDFALLDATRPDELVFTSAPLTQPLTVAWPRSAPHSTPQRMPATPTGT